MSKGNNGGKNVRAGDTDDEKQQSPRGQGIQPDPIADALLPKNLATLPLEALLTIVGNGTVMGERVTPKALWEAYSIKLEKDITGESGAMPPSSAVAYKEFKKQLEDKKALKLDVGTLVTAVGDLSPELQMIPFKAISKVLVAKEMTVRDNSSSREYMGQVIGLMLAETYKLKVGGALRQGENGVLIPSAVLQTTEERQKLQECFEKALGAKAQGNDGPIFTDRTVRELASSHPYIRRGQDIQTSPMIKGSMSEILHREVSKFFGSHSATPDPTRQDIYNLADSTGQHYLDRRMLGRKVLAGLTVVGDIQPEHRIGYPLPETQGLGLQTTLSDPARAEIWAQMVGETVATMAMALKFNPQKGKFKLLNPGDEPDRGSVLEIAKTISPLLRDVFSNDPEIAAKTPVSEELTKMLLSRENGEKRGMFSFAPSRKAIFANLAKDQQFLAAFKARAMELVRKKSEELESVKEKQPDNGELLRPQDVGQASPRKEDYLSLAEMAKALQADERGQAVQATLARGPKKYGDLLTPPAATATVPRDVMPPAAPVPPLASPPQGKGSRRDAAGKTVQGPNTGVVVAQRQQQQQDESKGATDRRSPSPTR